MVRDEIQITENNTGKDSLKKYFTSVGAFALIAAGCVLISAVRIGEHSFNAVHFWATMIMGALLVLYGYSTVKKSGFTRDNSLVLVISTAVSALMYLLFGPFTVVPLWLLGALAVSCFVDLSIGLFMAYFFLLQDHHYFGEGLTSLTVLFVISTILCIVSEYVGRHLKVFTEDNKERSIGSMIKKKTKEETTEKNLAYLESLASELDAKAVNDYDLNKSVIPEVKEAQTESFTDFVPEAVNAVSAYDYTEYASDNSELLETLKNVKKNAYMHSLRVAAIAGDCSEKLGFNRQFTRAVGLYHEIGKSREGDANVNTVAILTENKFPETIIHATDEVTNKDNLPFTSKEAFVVAICDTVITTYLYLKKTSSAVITNIKIIDSAMTKYMLNGRADNSGISVKDCGDIKNYLLGFLDQWENNAI